MHRIRPLILMFSALAIAMAACSVTAVPVQETTTSVPGTLPVPGFALLDDGLEPYAFGDHADTVIEGVSATVGGWDADSSDGDAIAPPICRDGRARVVSWGSLVLIFVTRAEDEVFAGWAYGFDPLTGNTDDHRDLNLTTPEGIGPGSTRADLVAAYGSSLSIVEDTTLDTATFSVAGQGITHLVGTLDQSGEDARVIVLETAPAC
jgi:hypothetical protein